VLRSGKEVVSGEFGVGARDQVLQALVQPFGDERRLVQVLRVQGFLQQYCDLCERIAEPFGVELERLQLLLQQHERIALALGLGNELIHSQHPSQCCWVIPELL
jgi:spore maturation protein SpmB